ncbi:hypothetical protein LRS71_07280 [Rhodococcus pyridinivorans]|uniref:hypothetical protein n=1 Tax=Rhodococcus pyridinivorans TaxID=103816 RepID=UPI001E4F8C9C|nr:hypothetical protein [Rhodococcus pyridinivorans]MCD5419362.1 hypothetical protein [Rhodococcus pyridinivorans]
MTHTSTTTDADTLGTATTVGIQLQRIRHFWPLVLLITLGAVIASAVSTYTAEPSYTGRTVLIVSSPGRVPEEDAVMVRGYIDLFNDPAYQARLRDSTDLPPGTTFEARTAAASSMIFVEATAGTDVGAKDAALALATNFRWDVDAVRRAEKDASLDALRSQLDERRRLLTEGADPAYTTQRIIELETLIQQLQGDSTNQLQILQPDAGIAMSEPSMSRNVLVGLLGGLVLGSVAAVLAALFSPTLSTSHDVHTRTGVNPLVEIPRGGSRRKGRARHLGFVRLATRAGHRQVPRPGTLAVVSPTRTPATGQVARAIAEFWAGEGERVVLLHADMHTATVQERTAADDAVTVRTALVRDLLDDPDAPLDRERFTHLLRRLRADADLVIVEVPPLTEDPFAHSACVVSDRTVLVLDRRSGRVGPTREAVELLADAELLGAVLVDPRTGSSLVRRLFRRNKRGESLATVRYERIDNLGPDTTTISSNGHHPDRDAATLLSGKPGATP